MVDVPSVVRGMTAVVRLKFGVAITTAAVKFAANVALSESAVAIAVGSTDVGSGAPIVICFVVVLTDTATVGLNPPFTNVQPSPAAPADGPVALAVIEMSGFAGPAFRRW